MPVSVRCRCGAEYVVEEVYLLPVRCRFCGGDEFYRHRGPPRPERAAGPSAASPAGVRPGPARLDRAEIAQYGGSKETLWGAIIFFAYCLPRPVADHAASGWTVLGGALRDFSHLLPLAMPVIAALAAVLLGLTLPGRGRGPVLALLAGLGILLDPGFAGMESGKGFVITGLFTFSGLAAGYAVVVRVEDSAGGRGLLFFSGLTALGFLTVFTLAIVGGVPLLRENPVLTLAIGASALAGILALPAATPWPSAPRAARAGRFCLWLGVLVWALRPIFRPMSGDAFYELAPILTLGGLLGLAATGVADAILCAAAEWRKKVGERLSRESVGFLERFNRNAVYGPDRRD